MPRPVKWRRVCGLPGCNRFGPLDQKEQARSVTMTLDEYETIRLIDLEGFNQEQCAKQMNVARTTVQGIYGQARKKLAESLVEGKILLIKGGEYRLCQDIDKAGRKGCKGTTSRPCCMLHQKGSEDHEQS